MAVTVATAGPVVVHGPNPTTLQPTLSTHATDDLLVLIVGLESSAIAPVEPAAPAGWNRVALTEGITDNLGMAWYVTRAESAAETPPTLVLAAGTTVAWSQVLSLRSSSGQGRVYWHPTWASNQENKSDGWLILDTKAGLGGHEPPDMLIGDLLLGAFTSRNADGSSTRQHSLNLRYQIATEEFGYSGNWYTVDQLTKRGNVSSNVGGGIAGGVCSGTATHQWGEGGNAYLWQHIYCTVQSVPVGEWGVVQAVQFRESKRWEDNFEGATSDEQIPTTSILNASWYGTLNYDKDQKVEGQYSLRINGYSAPGYSDPYISPKASLKPPFFFRWYSRLNSVTTGSEFTLARAQNYIRVLNGGIVRLHKDPINMMSGGEYDRTVTAIPANQWIRFEWWYGPDTQEVRIFWGVNLHGATPNEVLTGPSEEWDQSPTGITFIAARGSGYNHWLDAVEIDQFGTWIGPIGPGVTVWEAGQEKAAVVSVWDGAAEVPINPVEIT
jgi:hypothetical protein